jgi:hypothetical protein
MDSAAGWDPEAEAVEPPPHAPIAKIAISPSAAMRVRELMLTWDVPPKVPPLGAGGIRGPACPLFNTRIVGAGHQRSFAAPLSDC